MTKTKALSINLDDKGQKEKIMTTDEQGLCGCGSGHKDQIERYPVGAKVVATDAIPQVDADSVPMGTVGQVTGHCDDGRAWFRFEHEPQQGHTFHFPEQWVSVASVSTDKGQNSASVATVRAAIESVIDRGWKCSTNCDVQHPWQFPTELFPGDIEPDDEALKHRQAFIDAVISEAAKLQVKCPKEQKAKAGA